MSDSETHCERETWYKERKSKYYSWCKGGDHSREVTVAVVLVDDVGVVVGVVVTVDVTDVVGVVVHPVRQGSCDPDTNAEASRRMSATRAAQSVPAPHTCSRFTTSSAVSEASK